MSIQNLGLVCKALRSPRVRDFTKLVLKTGYIESFSISSAKVNLLIESTFAKLLDGQKNKKCIANLRKDLAYCSKYIYRLGDKDFWFHKSYLEYKSGTKDHADMSRILPHIVGKKILDFGSGSGYFASLVASKGHMVCGTDRLPPSKESIDNFFFHRMRTPIDISCGDNMFHTVISRSVLHHIKPHQRLKVLQSLSLCTKQRLLIKEEVYGPSLNAISPISKKHNPLLLKLYLSLSTKEQLHFLALMDFYGNAVAQGVVQMSLPFSFLPLDQWEVLLKKFRFRIIKKIPVLFESGSAHNSAHVWLICERF